MLTQQDLDRFVQSEAQNSRAMEIYREDLARYHVQRARAERERLRNLNGALSLVTPMLDAVVMAAGVGVLALAIFG